MSASTKRKQRLAEIQAGTDKKTIALQEEAKKKAVSKRKWTFGTIAVALFVAVVLFLNSNYLFRNTTALTVGGESFSPAQVNFAYGQQYQQFVSSYGSYASLFGLNTSGGLAGLKDQTCSMTEDGTGTWKDYFLESAIQALRQEIALTGYAKENGITLSDEKLQEIDEEYAGIDDVAKQNNYSSADNLFAMNYGRGVNKKIALDMEKRLAFAQEAYSSYYDGIEVTDAEVEEQYPSINIRHILVKAVADENGEYTDEAKETARAKAEEIYEEWKAGEATEESFALLAEQYSEDEGSNTNGGLYENVLQGQMVEEFDAFCFEEGRKAGDTGIVYGESGAYAGYHVMYFSGKGDPAENETGRSYIKSAKASDWLEEITEGVEAVKGSTFNLVGKT